MCGASHLDSTIRADRNTGVKYAIPRRKGDVPFDLGSLISSATGIEIAMEHDGQPT